MIDIVIVLTLRGSFKAVYDDAFPFAELGPLKVHRAGSVAWDEAKQGWVATRAGGRQSEPFKLRSYAVAWEQAVAQAEMVELERLAD